MPCYKTRNGEFGNHVLLHLLCTLMWVPVIMLAQINYNLNNLVGTTFKLGLPSGLILAAIGAFFALIGSSLFLLYFCRPRSEDKQIKHQRPTPEPSLSSYTKDSKYVYGRQPVYYIEQSPVKYIERHASHIERPGPGYIERPRYGYLASPIVEYRSLGNNYLPLLCNEENRPSS
ncbi:hypothetical protein CHS0354_004792 [Potamilus streckersoni]|uniref:Uncharacterized protein n=1 Tax=Potamilus streckersoni TaxID=2493646 RepID=A0AAE0TDZ2_9BIVA|nr:hypothetical protein CHS0354_004792 [Potamilus streckersoni]